MEISWLVVGGWLVDLLVNVPPSLVFKRVLSCVAALSIELILSILSNHPVP
jgi:hypothetical protein